MNALGTYMTTEVSILTKKKFSAGFIFGMPQKPLLPPKPQRFVHKTTRYSNVRLWVLCQRLVTSRRPGGLWPGDAPYRFRCQRGAGHSEQQAKKCVNPIVTDTWNLSSLIYLKHRDFLRFSGQKNFYWRN